MKQTQISAEIVGHSLSPQGDELISVLCTFPRIILAEVNTHRMLSKNTSSSRAIPFNKTVEAVRLVSLEVIIFVIIIVLLTSVPHAVLLNIDGHIFSKNFLMCMISYISFVILVISSTYSISVGRISSIPGLFAFMCEGIKKAAPIYIIYILAAQLYYSIIFVFSN
jgi:p-aminobenzoyl-glutamate transporter AbgT